MHDKKIDLTPFSEGGASSKELQHRSIIQDLLDASPNRRKFFKTLSMAGAMAGAAAAVEGTASAQSSSFTDFDILNFALNLEYLEAEFYTVATTGMNISQVGLTVTGSGSSGATSGGTQVPGLNGAALAIAQEIAQDEQTHVKFIQTAIASLGGTAIAKPAINLGALGIGFSSVPSFLTLARAFEDIGVTAYGGAAPLISSKVVLGYAARILAVEAYHAGNIRLQIAQNNVPTTALDGADHIPPPSGTQYFPTDNNALTEVRTPQQVLYLAYGGANLTSGGFFPAGVNGLFNTSAATAATSDNNPSTTGSGAITASPNPATPTTNGDSMTTISWSAPSGVTLVGITIGSPSGPLFAEGGQTGSAPTGSWVSNGMVFYLQNLTGGLPLTAANTLGTVTVTVT
ncbi:MAG: ferritin-like domain-containing protein [Bryobacteraceae bacterium]